MGNIIALISYLMPGRLFRQQVEYPSSLEDVFKENICKLDEDVVRHLRSLDVMRATADMLFTHLNENSRRTKNGPRVASQNIRECTAIASRLLISTERLVCDGNKDFISSVRSLLNCIVNNSGELFKSDTTRSIVLKINEYEPDLNVVQLTKDEVLGELQVENDLRNTIRDLESKLEEQSRESKTVEHLQNEVTNLKEKNSRLKKQNNDLTQNKDLQTKQLKEKDTCITKIEKEKGTLKSAIEKHNKNEKEMKKTIQELELERLKLKEEIKKKDLEVSEYITKQSSILKTVQDKETHLEELRMQMQGIVREKESQQNEYENKLEENEKKINQLKQELKTQSSITFSCEEKITVKDQEINDIKESLLQLEQQLKKTKETHKKDIETQIRMYESKLVKQDESIKDLKRSNLEKEHMIESYELDKIVITKENKTLNEKQIELQESLNSTKKKLLSSQDTAEQQNNKIEKVTRNLLEAEVTVNELKEEIGQKDIHINLLLDDCSKQKEEIEILRNRCQKMTTELTDIKSVKSIPVQLYCQQKNQWTSSLETQLLDLMRTEMQAVDNKIELNIYKTSRPSDVRPEIPLVLICVTISRLGTDVINATEGLTLTPNTAVVVFHHKDEHALPNQASERILTMKEMRGSGGIYDMAFKSDKGIYFCDFNTKAVESLITFIRRQII